MLLKHPRYEPGEILGRGAQGTVLRVVDREDRSRALVAKVWSSSSMQPDALATEFAILSRLHVRGLVRAHDWSRDEATGAPFFVEDFALGPDACEHVREARTPDERARRATNVLADLATTLGGLHAAGFVHGDIKPMHARVTTAGTKLLDLGCAVAHGTRPRGMTERYAAPELAHGAASARSDLYALGALALELGPIPPSLRAVAEALHAADPDARPASAYDVLAMLGRSANVRAGARPPPIGREDALAFVLARDGARVRYVTGPAGTGKSHLLEEARLAALFDGRSARLVDAAQIAAFIAFLRGDESAWPFASSPREPTLLLVDDVDRAPAELRSALVAFACRPLDAPLAVIASAREAPPHASVMALGALEGPAFDALCRAVGVQDVAAMRAASEGIPGIVVAASGRVPLSRDAVLARVRSLDEHASILFAAVALVGGVAPRELARALLDDDAESALGHLITAGLVTRLPDSLALFARSLAADVASALGSCARVDRVVDACLSLSSISPSALLSLARAPYPPTRRAALLERAAERARSVDARSDETDALRELAQDPKHRDQKTLFRLERLLRDAGRSADHAEVIAWLSDVPSDGAAVLATRRRAESAARAGKQREALALAEEAAARARDEVSSALALATVGAVHLYASDWIRAEDALVRARAVLAASSLEDREELARLDHNLGVASLVRGDLARAAEALERSLAIKRASSDLAGMRSSLLNLGIAYGKARRWDDARRSLDEALALARTLGQRAGAGWCLVALCDLEVRRGDQAAARRFASEAETLFDALPPPVRADLALALADAELAEGNGDAARAEIATISEELRRDDALVDARCAIALGRAHLATLPSDRRAAARLAIFALRRGRDAGFLEVEEPGRDLLRAARGQSEEVMTMGNDDTSDDDLWTAADRAATAPSVEAAARAILEAVIRMSGAERALLGQLDGAHHVVAAWGLDVDGLPIASPAERIPPDAVTGTAGVRYLRDVEAHHHRRGSRMSVVRGSPGVVLVVEQRFVAGAFDTLAANVLERAATLAALALRTPSRATPTMTELDEAPSGSTTVLPLREARRAFPSILGSSRVLSQALARLDAAIDTDLPVLLLGETGTGKELFARALHDRGRRSSAPFVALNCAAVPDALFEAELFGHVRGAFTGADRARPGLLARAEGGTIFLDEIGDLAPARQATLLRAVESGRYRAVGSDDERSFDARIVAATHRDLATAAKAGTFRSDLLFRLAVLEVRIPPLRERDGDVTLLARHFLDAAGGGELAPRALEAIAQYTWPGNVRELAHVMQRLAALRAPRIEWQHLPREIRSSEPKAAPAAKPALDERGEVERALAESSGNISHAAVRLGITRHGLKKRMLRLGMRSK
jgi:DNA-binding NtrC family response regulator/tetratricopeptide (TPR) repeat protein